MKIALTILKAIATGASLLSIAGCAPLTPNLDSRFGDSVRVIRAQQTMAPDASSNSGIATLDGRAAHEVIGRYNKSYSAPTPQPNVFTIGVGSGK
jgi:hypothetical protein